MPHTQALQSVEGNELSETELIDATRRGDGSAFRVIMQRHNRRLYRVARSVVGDDSEAEDVVQEAYVRAFTGLAAFRGDASLATWLTRIALNEALGRRRRRRPTVDVQVVDSLQDRTGARILMFPTMDSDPEQAAGRRDVRRLLEAAIEGLPASFRAVFMMRLVEGMSVEETAGLLGLRAETVKTRLHRARRLLRKALDDQLSSALAGTFPFDGARCGRLTDAVLARLGISTTPPAA